MKTSNALITSILCLAGCTDTPRHSTTGVEASKQPVGALEKPEKADITQDERMAWWREARFGLFIHWGLYSIPAGEWGNETDYGEWIRDSAKIELPEYEGLLAKFDPVKFDAERWADIAQKAGVQYLVITSKHHDGFCLFDSKETDWDVASTPFHRDILKELSEACARHSIRFCTYHSIMDWHHPDYLPRRPWEKRSAAGADFARYEAYLHAQVSEIVSRYHPGLMWFDGEWESTWTHERGVALFELCRSLDPAMIVNNRVDVHRSGTQGFSRDPETLGDYATPEQEIPASGAKGVDWETCMTMNDHWGFNAHDQDWKSSKQLIRMLVDIASKGGNFLLNVGPTAEGEFPAPSVERLAAIGAWLATNGVAIHGTQASPFAPFESTESTESAMSAMSNGSLDFGRCTVKAHGADTTLYLHVFDAPADGLLHLRNIANEPIRATRLADPAQKIRCVRDEDGIVVDLGRAPLRNADPACDVVALEIVGKPAVHRPPTIEAASETFIGTQEVRLVPSVDRCSVRYTLDGTEPTVASTLYRGPFLVDATCTLRARAFDGSHASSSSSLRAFTLADPRPAFAPPSRKAGVLCERFVGDFDALPDLEGRKPDGKYVLPEFALPTGSTEEHVARRFTGFVEVPKEGVYRFTLTSDDGSRLYVDDELLVDNDGLHSPLRMTGDIALARGFHHVRVEWFNKTGGATLQLLLGLAGHAGLPIPRDDLGHVPGADEPQEAPGDRVRGR